MDTDPRVPKGIGDSMQIQQQPSAGLGVSQLHSAILLPPFENTLPQPVYDVMTQGAVMTADQLDTLRRQISAYSTICQQLVAMHQAMAHQQLSLSGGVLSHSSPYDAIPMGSAGLPSAKTRVRWTPQPAQLQILEKYFTLGNGTPNKSRIREITAELHKHGPIAESNVYNWFQNRKARAKRKHSSAGSGGGGDDGDGEEGNGDHAKRSRPDVDATDNDYLDTDQGPATDGDVDDTSPSTQGGIDSTASYGVDVQYHPGYQEPGENEMMQVSINGKAWDVPPGLLDVKNSFGPNAVIIDSDGNPVPTNEYGVTLHPLKRGGTYTCQGGVPEVGEPEALPQGIGIGEQLP